MMKAYALIAFVVCILPGACPAYQLIGTEALSKALVAQHYTISDNLDAVIVVDRTMPTFEYHTFYCAGPTDEEEGQQGQIHFLEHIMLDTGSHAPGKLDQIIANNGGQNYAFTTIHFMYLTLKFPKDKFDLAVEIDRDRFYNTVINEEVVEKEKKIILTERSRHVTDIDRRFTNYLFGLVYGKKQFSYIGDEAFIKQIEPVGLREYYENFLRLQKRLVVVIGDVEVDHVLTRLDEAYGQEQESRAWHPVQYPRLDVLGKKFKRTSKNLSFSRFEKSWYTSGLDHRDYAGLFILTHILDKPSNSLRSSVVDSKLATVFRMRLNHFKGFGLMGCQADLPHNASPDAVEAAIQQKLEEIKTQGISEDELTAARNLRLKRMYSGFYDRSDMAYEFGQAFAHTGDPLRYPKFIKDLESIRAEDIPRIIGQYLTNENSITLSLTLKIKNGLHAP